MTPSLVQSVPSSSPSCVCVVRRRSRTNPASWRTSVAGRSAGKNSAAARIPARSSVTDPATAKTQLAHACSLAHLKTETKCLASRNNEGNTKKTLKCDDECARLERNRRLALALNIDPETHKDDHVPYSSATLRLYVQNPTWSAPHEREFRIFAADDAAKRLRFKPMQKQHRAFLHNLAQDFGLDSESLDPEPHRHVCIFKTPRFVAAPMKTLAECMRIVSPILLTSG
ncbi:MAG: hypothetical protein LQ340_005778, partial [Diploschistes diacapsis]